MSKMIKELTPAQVAKFASYSKKWLGIGLSTEPIDLEKATKAALKIYKSANLADPESVYYARSPIEALKKAKKITGEKISHPFAFGAHDASWLSFYDFFKTELHIKECERLVPLMEMAEVCGWWIPFDKFVILEDRPSQIKLDHENLLHNEEGPAIEYRDGFSVYSWHGTRIPGEWITNKKKLTAGKALKWENLEQRRVACEILGWDNILNTLSAKTIDRDEDPEIGELLEVSLPDIGIERFLRVTCGTGRVFALPVPQEVQTALEANAWTYGLTAKDYKPEVRT